jgi:hypothetical protein
MCLQQLFALEEKVAILTADEHIIGSSVEEIEQRVSRAAAGDSYGYAALSEYLHVFIKITGQHAVSVKQSLIQVEYAKFYHNFYPFKSFL